MGETKNKNTPQSATNMINRKIWKIWQCLSDKEKNLFISWLQNELKGKYRHLLALAKGMHTGKDQAPTASRIWVNIYPDRPLDKQKLYRMCSELLPYLELFISIEQLKQKKDLQSQLLMETLVDRAKGELFESYLRKNQQRLAQKAVKSSSDYLFSYQMEMMLRAYSQRTYTFPDATQRTQLALDLDVWWFHQKLMNVCISLSDKQVYRVPDTDPWESTTSMLFSLKENLIPYPILRLLVSIYQLHMGLKEGDTKELFEELQRIVTYMNWQEAYTCYHMLLNYHINLLNQKDEGKDASMIYQLHQWGLENELLFVGPFLPEHQYKNLITNCLILDKPEKAWAYLQQLKEKLPPENREEAYKINVGAYYFHQREYDKVIETLNQERFSNGFYHLHSRTLYFMAAYLIHNLSVDELVRGIDSLLKYLRRHPLQDQTKAVHNNFLRLFRRLILAVTDNDLQRLQQQIDATTPLVRKTWLEEQIEKKRNDSSKRPQDSLST